MHINEDLRAADAAATRDSVAVVAGVTTEDLVRATPCAGWNLLGLVAHMTAQHHGFAAAARGHGDDEAAWRPAAADDPVKAYAAAAEEVLTAFADDGVLDREFFLPEAGVAVPARLAIGFHLVDYLVHGWDVARAVGVAYRPSPAAVAAALPIARAVPDGPDRREPGAAFAPGRAVPPGTGAMAEILLRLGRDPG